MPQQPPQVVKATLTALPSGSPLTVHFNPASLVYSVDNSVAQQSGGPKKVQYVAQFSGKLTMDLQFDTTDTGSDVRIATNQVALLMQATGNAQAAAQNAAPPSANGGAQSTPPKAPPVLQFQWGSYTFQGIMDSFKETIDFFSADGVALRALVSIGLSRQDQVFDEGQQFSQATTAGSLVPSSSSDSALSVATRGGDPSAARQLGTDNGLDSLRFTGGISLQVSAGVQLNPPAAFVTVPSAGASAGLGLGISLGASAAISASGIAGTSGGGSAPSASPGSSVRAAAGSSSGAQVGPAAPVKVGVQAGTQAGGQGGSQSGPQATNPSGSPTGIPSSGPSGSPSGGSGSSGGGSGGIQTSGMGAPFGSSASAGVPATAGAFAGLQSGRATVSTTANLNPMQMLPSTVSTGLATFDGASYSIGGQARSTGSAGLSTDVGTQFNFSDRLTFSSEN